MTVGRGRLCLLPLVVCFVLTSLMVLACNTEAAVSPSPSSVGAEEQAIPPPLATPPFDVRDDSEGLLLVWYDAEGAHTADRREDIPEPARRHVRVDSLRVDPSARLDPGWVYMADLRAASEAGQYAVRRVRRSVFEGLVTPREERSGEANQVILYGASWCGACRAAGSFLRERKVGFVERDIEKEPGARAEMQRKLDAAGLKSGGIPVLDVRGTLVTGFDQGRIEALLAR